MTTPTDGPVVARVRAIVTTIASDLGLDVYDIEQRGATLRITLDTPPGSDSGVTLDQITLATRLINREFDHEDPVPGRYTLEVSSPGVERTLRLPAHFQREVGKVVALRLTGVEPDLRRLTGTLVSADDSTVTVASVDQPEESRVIPIDAIDRARTVFEWGPQPKPGAARSKGARSSRSARAASQAGEPNELAPGSAANQSEPAGEAGTRLDKETS